VLTGEREKLEDRVQRLLGDLEKLREAGERDRRQARTEIDALRARGEALEAELAAERARNETQLAETQRLFDTRFAELEAEFEEASARFDTDRADLTAALEALREQNGGLSAELESARALLLERERLEAERAASAVRALEAARRESQECLRAQAAGHEQATEAVRREHAAERATLERRLEETVRARDEYIDELRRRVAGKQHELTRVKETFIARLAESTSRALREGRVPAFSEHAAELSEEGSAGR
jgi:hypothetical protein